MFWLRPREQPAAAVLSQEGTVLDCVSHQLLAEWRPNKRSEIKLTAGFPPATESGAVCRRAGAKGTFSDNAATPNLPAHPRLSLSFQATANPPCPFTCTHVTFCPSPDSQGTPGPRTRKQRSRFCK